MRILIVDDEAPARRKIRDLLGGEEGIELVGEAADGRQAVQLILETKPDLVFLDIQMPELDGFAVIEEVGLDAVPMIVFVTAYDQHALRAFDVHAFDYLVKPFAPSRFRRLMARVRRQLTKHDHGGWQRRLEGLLDELHRKPEYLQQVRVHRSAQREVLLPVESIDRIYSERNDLRFLSGGELYWRRGTLSDLEHRLDPAKFMRINRSEIVRLEAIAELQPWFRGDYRVIMKDGAQLSWSRRYRSRAKGRF